MSRPEDALQSTIVETILRPLEKAGLLRFYAVRNEGKRTEWERSQILRMGLRAGVPDLVLLFPGGSCAYVELKAAKGVLSDKQERWRDWLQDAGFRWALVRSVDEMRATLTGWGVAA